MVDAHIPHLRVGVCARGMNSGALVSVWPDLDEG